MFSTSVSSCSCERLDVPLNAMCSRKCATPLFASDSYLLPVSIHTPTVAVSPPVDSLATRSWLGSVVTCVGCCATAENERPAGASRASPRDRTAHFDSIAPLR